MYKDIISKYPDYKNTCSINELSDGCITFIRNKKYLNLSDHKDVIILVPKEFTDLPEGWKYEFVDNVDYVFTMIHNILNESRLPLENVIGQNCYIHPSSAVGVEGLHVAKSSSGELVQLKHMGNVVIENNVMILAQVTLLRAVFGSTIIGAGTKVDSRVHLGHNIVVGKNCAIAAGVIIAGSVNIGNNCMIGIGALIRNGISICDNVIIGMGSNVVYNITESGIYMGSPAKLFKPYNKGWNF